MDRWEYRVLSWQASADGGQVADVLNEFGTEGWEAVGVAPRSAPAVMAGMGGVVVPEMVVLLKRRRSS